MSRALSALRVDWCRAVEARLDRPPERPRVPLGLKVAGAASTIGSIEPGLALELAGAGLPLRDDGSAWQIEVTDPTAIDPTLERIARWLQANRKIAGWRDELLAVVDAGDRRVGAIERAAVRPLGIATRAVHLVVHDGRGRVWVQQRALDKATDPGRWDTTMGGLMSDGESFADTLARETWEEAGLRVDEMERVVRFGRITVRRPLIDGYMVEHIEMVEAGMPDAMRPVNQDGEVARFERLDLAALIDRLHDDAFTFEAARILALWIERTVGSAHQ